MKRLTDFLKSHLHRNFWLFLALFLLTFHQASILTFMDFALDVMSRHNDSGKTFSGHVDVTLAKKFGLSKIALKFFQYQALLFACQLVPTFIYGCFESIKRKRRAALFILFSPIFMGLLISLIFLTPSINAALLAIFYLLISPLVIISFFPFFMFFESFYSMEDFEIYLPAVLCWFYVFWIGIIIRDCLFPKLFSRRTSKNKIRKAKI
jgi:hypothetical protein